MLFCFRKGGAIIELQRLTSVFDGDTKSFEDAVKKVDKGFTDVEKRASDSVSRFDRISTGIGSALGKGITVGLGNIGGVVDSLTSITSAALGSIPIVGKGIAAAFDESQGAIKQAIGVSFDFNDAMRRNSISLGLVAGGANDAAKELKGLRSISSNSEFGLPSIIASARELQIMQNNARDVVPEIRAIGNAAAALDIGESGLIAIADVLSRISELGKASTRDVRSLVRQGIPVFDILKGATGLSKDRSKRLLDSGRISANDFIDILLGDFQKRYPDAAKQMSQTIEVQNKKLTSGMNALKGAAFKGLYDVSVQGLSDANKVIRSQQVGSIAASLNVAASPVTGMIQSSLKALEAGDLFGGALQSGESMVEGLKKGITEKAGEAYDTIKGWAQGAVDAFGSPQGIDSNSPSRKFEALGQYAADGFSVGFNNGMDEATQGIIARVGRVLDETYGTLDAHKGRRSLTQADIQTQTKANLDKLTQREPEFLPKLKRLAAQRGINPDYILNVMAVETAGSFLPSKQNPTSTATGLIQFMKATMDGFRNKTGFHAGLMTGTGQSHADLKNMSATQQLDWVFKYFDQPQFRGRLNSQGAVYASIGVGHAGANDDSVLMRRGERGYAGNAPTWDRNMDGMIRQSEMAMAAISKLGAGINFTVNGTAISDSNPLPISITAAPYIERRGDLTGGIGEFLPGAFDRPDPHASDPIIGASDELKDFGNVALGVTSITMRALQPLPGVFNDIGQSGADSGDQIEQAYQRAARKLQGFRGELLQLGITTKDVGDSFESHFSEAFDHIGEEGHSFARDLAIGILQDIRHNIGAGVAGELRDAIFGSADGEKKGIVSKVGGWLGKHLGVGGGAPASVASGTDSEPLVMNTSATDLNTMAIERLTAMMQMGGSPLGKIDSLTKVFDSEGIKNTITDSEQEIATALDNQGALMESVFRDGANRTESAIRQLENTLIAVQPRSPGFLQTIFGAAIDGLASGIGGKLSHDIFGNNTSDEGGSQPRPTVAPTLKRALGGFVPPGAWAITGEEGAEPVFGGRAGVTVVPNASTIARELGRQPRLDMQSFANGFANMRNNESSKVEKHFHIHITTPPGGNPAQTQRNRMSASQHAEYLIRFLREHERDL